MGAVLGSTLDEFTQQEVDIYEQCTCLSPYEMTIIYEKFRKMGGRRLKKGEEELKIGMRIGHKTAKNLAAPRGSVLTGGQDALRQLETSRTNAPATSEPANARKVTKEAVSNMPEFNNNPFISRLCDVFSSDGTGDLSFDELLDMFHALSPKAERKIKILTAFRVYDFDNDGYLGVDDITKLIQTTTAAKKKGRAPSVASSAQGSRPRSGSQPETPASASSTTRDPSAAALAAQLEEGSGTAVQSQLTDTHLMQVIEHVMTECDLDGRGRLSFHEFEVVMNRFPDLQAKFSINMCS